MLGKGSKRPTMNKLHLRYQHYTPRIAIPTLESVDAPRSDNNRATREGHRHSPLHRSLWKPQPDDITEDSLASAATRHYRGAFKDFPKGPKREESVCDRVILVSPWGGHTIPCTGVQNFGGWMPSRKGSA
jgi:hypothetical protein